MQLTPWLPLSCVSIVLYAITATRSKANCEIDWVTGFSSLLPAACVYCYYGSGGAGPKAVILIMAGVYVARLWVVLTRWFGSTAAAKISEVVDEGQYMVLSLLLVTTFVFIYSAPFYSAAQLERLDLPQYVAIGVYVVGTVFHFGADYQKHVFKQNPANKGVLLQSGFWGMSRHPNYFGDFLIFLSFALLVPTTWFAYVSPVVNLAQYSFDAIPKSEQMAARRYGAKWTEYANSVACFVPFLF